MKAEPSIPNMLGAALFIFPIVGFITQELAWLWGVPITIALGAAAYFPSKEKDKQKHIAR